VPKEACRSQTMKLKQNGRNVRNVNTKDGWAPTVPTAKIREERLQDYIQKKDFAENQGVCDECSKIAEKSIVCIFCNVCVHPVSRCCRFAGDRLSCIECHETRHEYKIKIAVPNRASLPQDLKNQDNPSTNFKAPPVSDNTAEKEDERKPAAKDKKVDEDAIPKLKEPPKPANEKYTEDDRKPADKKIIKTEKGLRLGCRHTQAPKLSCKI
jgi:hypothetical protein